MNSTNLLVNDKDKPTNDTKIKNKKYQKIITKELSFKNQSSQNILAIDNITGAINVQGYNGNTIKIEIEKVIIADNDKELQKGIKETNIKIVDIGNEKHLYLDSPYSTFNATTGEFSYKNNCGGSSCFSYKFQLHYTLKVPYHTNLKLSTINGGDIKVNNIDAHKIKTKHISGSIYLNNISGTTDAFTISGEIKATYDNNPPQESFYITTSGNINVHYKTGLDAKVSYEIKDGELITDFNAISLHHKKHKYTSNILKSPVKIGSGKVNLFFKTVSGDVYLNKY